MPDIDVINFQRKFSIPKSRIVTLVKKCHRSLKLKHPAINIVFVGATRMRTINKKYLNHDYVTDVITFDQGDIVICPAMAQSFAKQYGQGLSDEILLYVVHGLLHLAGYKDKTTADIAHMRKMEARMLAFL